MTKEQGFSLIEVLIALVVLGVVTAGVTPAFLHHLKTITTNEIRTGAIQAAQLVLDELRVENPQNMPSSGSDAAENIQIGSRTYSSVTRYCDDNSLCTIDTRQIFVTVSFQNKEIYEVETVYTRLR